MKRLLVGLALALCLLPAAAGNSSLVTEDQRRGVEQTFLTFPEWFLVHSPAEYAYVVAQRPPQDFPFARHIEQLWTSYAAVTREQSRNRYPANVGYHFMIMVIATSTTVEYALRWAYENSFGRVSWSTASALTDEDRYAARAARDYVDFIRQEPWYLFDFGARLKGLWTEVRWWGPNPLRKWERRYALTTEYLIKATYAKLIEKGTRTVYEPAKMITQVVADQVPKALPPRVELVRTLPDGRIILNLPRYFDFRIAATNLAQQGVRLLDIAGNDSVILLTVWAPAAQDAASLHARLLFQQPLISHPGQKRMALVLPVRSLSGFLAEAEQRQLTVEHVYDY